MKKRLIMLFATGIVSAALVGCTGSTASESKVSSATSDGISVEESLAEDEMAVGMANPMAEINDDGEFASQLGISIDTTFLPEENRQKFIIGKTLADIRFEVTNVDGEIVKCQLRATKDMESAKNPYELIAGVYATDYSDETVIDYGADEGNISIKSVESQTDKCHISFWMFNDTAYTFSVFGTTSQMQMGALYDSVMLAIGADVASLDEVSVVEPLPNEIDVNSIEGGVFPADIENVETDENGTIADFTIYTVDLYDAVELNSLEAGDIVKVKSSSFDEYDEIIVDTVEHKEVNYTSAEEAMGAEKEGAYDVIIINGGIEEGGAEFIAGEGGTYRFFGFDDYPTYSVHGKVSLTIAEDAVIVDHSEDWASGEEFPAGVTIKTTELMHFTGEDTIGFDSLNTTVAIENGVVTQITRRFTP